MKKIFKYEIPVTDVFGLMLPKNANILTVQTQRNIPCIWALINTNEQEQERYFKLVGTGHQIVGIHNDDLVYIGTFQLMQGELVYHLFEAL